MKIINSRGMLFWFIKDKSIEKKAEIQKVGNDINVKTDIYQGVAKRLSKFKFFMMRYFMLVLSAWIFLPITFNLVKIFYIFGGGLFLYLIYALLKKRIKLLYFVIYSIVFLSAYFFIANHFELDIRFLIKMFLISINISIMLFIFGLINEEIKKNKEFVWFYLKEKKLYLQIKKEELK